MYDVLSTLKSLLKLDQVCIDNNVFRLHYKVTMVLLIIFSLINTSRQYIGDPIDCVTDNRIPQQIMDTYCWITATFTVPSKVGRIGIEVLQPGVANHKPTDKIKHHKFYQWVCFVLFFQAVLFYIPRYLWKIWEGGKVGALVSDFKMISLNRELMDEKCQILCSYMENHLQQQNIYFFRFVFCEILNFINVVSQMFLMDRFLDGEFSTFGWDVVSFTEMQQHERIDPMSLVFPKLAKCTFYQYGGSATIENIDALCVLPVNVVNEKIYVFLWFWFVILATVSGLGLVYRVMTICMPWLRLVLLKTRHRIAAASIDIEFLCSHFAIGDWFVFYQISCNMDSIAFHQTVTNLAECMRKKRKHSDRHVSSVV